MNTDVITEKIVELIQGLTELKTKFDIMKNDNDNNHKEILDRIEKLCIHVNHENELMCNRIGILEATDKKYDIEWKLLAKIAGTVVASISFIVFLLKLIGAIQ